MINNDTKPPKNNYMEKNTEEWGIFKVAMERLAKSVFFRLMAFCHEQTLIHIWPNCCSNRSHWVRQQNEPVHMKQGQLTVEEFWMTVQKMGINLPKYSHTSPICTSLFLTLQWFLQFSQKSLN